MAFGQAVSFDAFEQLMTPTTDDAMAGYASTKSAPHSQGFDDVLPVYRNIEDDEAMLVDGSGNVSMSAGEPMQDLFAVPEYYAAIAAKDQPAGSSTASVHPSTEPVEPVLVWSAADLSATLPTPATLPLTPFFLRSNYRVLVAPRREALELVATALLAAGCDLGADPAPTTGRAALMCAVSSSTGRCDFDVHEFTLPVVEGGPETFVFELHRVAGDKFTFNTVFVDFSRHLQALATEGGATFGLSIHSPGVPSTYGSAHDPHLAAFAAGSPSIVGTAAFASTTESAAAASTAASSKAPVAAPARSPSPVDAAAASPEAEPTAADMEAARREYESLVEMLNAEQDDMREEGAARILALLQSSRVCRRSLREKGALGSLINALVRAQSGPGCHSLVAKALAGLSSCPACAQELVDHGAVFALTAMVASPCRVQTVRLRRAAAQGLSNLAVIPEAAAQAADSGVIAFLRYSARACSDSAFQADATAAANALDPAATIAASAPDEDAFRELASRAHTAAVDLAKAASSTAPATSK